MDEQTRLDLAYAVIGRQKIEIEELLQQWNEQRQELIDLRIEHARVKDDMNEVISHLSDELNEALTDRLERQEATG